MYHVSRTFRLFLYIEIFHKFSILMIIQQMKFFIILSNIVQNI